MTPASNRAQGDPQGWKVTPHPFGGGYCAWHKGADGRVNHLLSVDGCSAKTFQDREAARAAIAAATQGGAGVSA